MISPYRSILILIILLMSTLVVDARVTSLFGKLINHNEIEQLIPIDETSQFKGNQAGQMIRPDSLGYFNINLYLDTPTYFMIGYNYLYISPGDSLEVTIDMKAPTEAIFVGKSADLQRYLINTPRPKSGSYLDGGRGIKKTHEETIAHILKIAEERKTILDKIVNIPPEFGRLEIGRINADLINSLEAIPSYATYIYKTPEEKSREEYDKISTLTSPLLKKYATGFVDSTFLKLLTYQKILYIIIPYNKDTEGIQSLKNHSAAVSLSRKLNSDHIIDDSVAMQSLKLGIKKTANPIIKSALNAQLKRIEKQTSISLTLDFKTLTGSGSLEQLKDKIIYIDLWATWCMPCLEERSYYKELAKEYKNKVVFLAISIDRDFEKWKAFVTQENNEDILNGWVLNTQLEDFNVVAIPRYILIDKGLKLIDFHAQRPDAPQLKEKLDELLNL